MKCLHDACASYPATYAAVVDRCDAPCEPSRCSLDRRPASVAVFDVALYAAPLSTPFDLWTRVILASCIARRRAATIHFFSASVTVKRNARRSQ